MDTSIFNMHYKKYNKMIHYLLHHFKVYYQYEDYYQLLLIKMWELIQNYDASKTEHLDHYMYTKLKFHLIDCIRKQSKDMNRFVPTSETHLLDRSFHEFYQYEWLSLLDILSEEELTWLNLTLQGFSTQEIGLYMNKSVSTIKYYRKNARKKLKTHFLI
ncbi:sigma-70 family RNA polymerase sigma factor [Mammaliicoccus sp. Dog046]|uniref:sigma-70 family RNA polymerase sigma factor n=1 Tax=Mammaliicoccus sp. Dog046 TaxID=3034233 RepID=UPI002B25E312|nr:sigma-70 family RNA polymerase sigma factor [Mammaliicoccus sp. Dog046]WQK86374.1 sigma-70 family RNA polymerase sigma factor [Mammaliicoccus sp. Dog046]